MVLYSHSCSSTFFSFFIVLFFFFRWSLFYFFFFFSSRRRHTICSRDWSSDVCSSDLCARFLRHENGQHNRLYRFSEGAFNGLLRTYDVSLRWVLRHQFLILLVTLGTVCLNLYLFVKTPKGFFPQQDTGRFTGLVQGVQDLSFAAMSQKMRQFTDIVMSDPAVESVTSFTGGGSGGSTARMFGQLKPLGERKISVDQVIARIRAKTAKNHRAALYLQAV